MGAMLDIGEHDALCSVCMEEPATQLVRVISRFSVAEGARRHVQVCDNCREAMPFDFGKFVERLDALTKPQGYNEAFLELFVRQFLEEVWVDDKPPSYIELCHVLNAAGVRSEKGQTWLKHNLMQKLQNLGLDKDELVLSRQSRPYAERLQACLDRAAAVVAGGIAKRIEELGQGPEEQEYAPAMAELDDLPGLAPLEV